MQTTSTTRPPAAPPPAPDRASRIRLSVGQGLGLPLMALIPLLAIAGLFGERSADLQTRTGPMAVSIRVPTRFRYRQRMTLELAVSNRGAASIDDVRVRIDSAYLDRFSNVTLTPPVGADGGVRLGALQAGQTARMTATLEGEDAGTHRGVAVVTDAAADTARVALASIVFP